MMQEMTLPANLDAERATLGALILDPDAMLDVADFLRPDHFYRDSHQIIYGAMLSLYERHEPADPVMIADFLDRTEKLEVCGGFDGIMRLMSDVVTSGNVAYHARIVERAAIRRRLIHVGGQIVGIAHTSEDANSAMEQASQLLYAVNQAQTYNDFSTSASIVDDCLTDLEALHSREKAIVGVPTGFSGIDYYLGGMQRSDLIILAARPGMGKSSYMLSVAYNAVFQYAQKVAIFSLEMSKKQLMQRLLSYDSGIDLYRLRNGQIRDEEWDTLMKSRDHLATDKLNIDDTGGISIAALRNKARRLKAHQGLDLIIVDYLQLMHASSENKNRNREQEVAEVSTGLKEIAKELDVPVLALAQLSRAVESRGDKTPQLSDLRESGSIENDADIVQFIYRDEYYHSDTNRPGTADIIIAKHRNGPTGEVVLAFKANQTRFENLEVSL